MSQAESARSARASSVGVVSRSSTFGSRSWALRRLLRPRHERPRGGRAAEKRYEIAPFYLIELHSVPVSQGRIIGYRTGEDQSAGIAGILQPVRGADVRFGSFASD